jgi:2-haloacid dehalogenase
MSFKTPKFITFDCYGTLTNFQIGPTARALFKDRVPADRMDGFIETFRGYRLDEVLGAWKPYLEVLSNAIERTCKQWKIKYEPSDGQALYDAVPTWGPHADVPAGLAKVARHIPLVALSNAANEQIQRNVDLLGAPFHQVLTAEMAGAYKPRQQAFEFMFDELGCGPEDVLHCSSSFRYDLMTAYDMGIRNKAWVNRGHEPANPFYEYREIKDIGGLAGLVGL